MKISICFLHHLPLQWSHTAIAIMEWTFFQEIQKKSTYLCISILTYKYNNGIPEYFPAVGLYLTWTSVWDERMMSWKKNGNRETNSGTTTWVEWHEYRWWLCIFLLIGTSFLHFAKKENVDMCWKRASSWSCHISFYLFCHFVRKKAFCKDMPCWVKLGYKFLWLLQVCLSTDVKSINQK